MENLLSNPGGRSEIDLEKIIQDALLCKGEGEKVALLSRSFLGIPYREGTLAGDAETPEVFTINLAAVDCFTFIDYVEALRLSGSFEEFVAGLRRVRYRGGEVDFSRRNHFFTDWISATPRHVRDVTAAVGRGREARAWKQLNRKADGDLYLPGIRVRKRAVTYIPAGRIDSDVAEGLATGDYVGISAEEEGLDVTHVGIVIRQGAALLLRHASSTPEVRSVVDTDFAAYVRGKPGIVVLRPLRPRRTQAASERPKGFVAE